MSDGVGIGGRPLTGGHFCNFKLSAKAGNDRIINAVYSKQSSTKTKEIETAQQ